MAQRGLIELSFCVLDTTVFFYRFDVRHSVKTCLTTLEFQKLVPLEYVWFLVFHQIFHDWGFPHRNSFAFIFEQSMAYHDRAQSEFVECFVAFQQSLLKDLIL